MTPTDTPPETATAPTALSATVLLVRDGAAGLEVLMVVRHHEIDFARGAAVFPGGKVAPSDHDARLLAHGADMAETDPRQRALRVAAIRETFEECGLLLGRDAQGRSPDRTRLATLRARWQERIAQTSTAFAEMLHEEALWLACDSLQPFAHWVTPVVAPKRFDTHFFIVAAPPDQDALHDGSEAVDSFWTRPVDALQDCLQGRRTIIYPTLANLALLAQTPSVAAAVAAARARPYQRILPTIVKRGDGKRIPELPAQAGYPSLPEALMDLVAR